MATQPRRVPKGSMAKPREGPGRVKLSLAFSLLRVAETIEKRASYIDESPTAPALRDALKARADELRARALVLAEEAKASVQCEIQDPIEESGADPDG